MSDFQKDETKLRAKAKKGTITDEEFFKEMKRLHKRATESIVIEDNKILLDTPYGYKQVSSIEDDVAYLYDGAVIQLTPEEIDEISGNTIEEEIDVGQVYEAGTSAGAKKAWDRRGRGRKAEDEPEHEIAHTDFDDTSEDPEVGDDPDDTRPVGADGQRLGKSDEDWEKEGYDVQIDRSMGTIAITKNGEDVWFSQSHEDNVAMFGDDWDNWDSQLILNTLEGGGQVGEWDSQLDSGYDPSTGDKKEEPDGNKQKELETHKQEREKGSSHTDLTLQKKWLKSPEDVERATDEEIFALANGDQMNKAQNPDGINQKTYTNSGSYYQTYLDSLRNSITTDLFGGGEISETPYDPATGEGGTPEQQWGNIGTNEQSRIMKELGIRSRPKNWDKLRPEEQEKINQYISTDTASDDEKTRRSDDFEISKSSRELVRMLRGDTEDSWSRIDSLRYASLLEDRSEYLTLNDFTNRDQTTLFKRMDDLIEYSSQHEQFKELLGLDGEIGNGYALKNRLWSKLPDQDKIKLLDFSRSLSKQSNKSKESKANEEFKEDEHPRKDDGKFTSKGSGSSGGGKDTKTEKPSWMPSEEELHKQAESDAKEEYWRYEEYGDWDYDLSEEEKEEAIAEQKGKLIKKAENKHKQDNIHKRTDKFSQKKHDELIEISWRMMSTDERDNAINHIGQDRDKWEEKYSFGSGELSFKEAYDRLYEDYTMNNNFSLYDALAYTGGEWNYKNERDNVFLVGMSPEYDLERFERINNKIIQGHNTAKNNMKDSEKKMKSAQRVLNSLQKKGDAYAEAGEDLYWKAKRNMDNAKYELDEYDERLKATKEMDKKMKSLAKESKATEDSLIKIEDDKDDNTQVTVLDEWKNETHPDKNGKTEGIRTTKEIRGTYESKKADWTEEDEQEYRDEQNFDPPFPEELEESKAREARIHQQTDVKKKWLERCETCGDIRSSHTAGIDHSFKVDATGVEFVDKGNVFENSVLIKSGLQPKRYSKEYISQQIQYEAQKWWHDNYAKKHGRKDFRDMTIIEKKKVFLAYLESVVGYGAKLPKYKSANKGGTFDTDVKTIYETVKRNANEVRKVLMEAKRVRFNNPDPKFWWNADEMRTGMVLNEFRRAGLEWYSVNSSGQLYDVLKDEAELVAGENKPLKEMSDDELLSAREYVYGTYKNLGYMKQIEAEIKDRGIGNPNFKKDWKDEETRDDKSVENDNKSEKDLEEITSDNKVEEVPSFKDEIDKSLELEADEMHEDIHEAKPNTLIRYANPRKLPNGKTVMDRVRTSHPQVLEAKATETLFAISDKQDWLKSHFSDWDGSCNICGEQMYVDDGTGGWEGEWIDLEEHLDKEHGIKYNGE